MVQTQYIFIQCTNIKRKKLNKCINSATAHPKKEIDNIQVILHCIAACDLCACASQTLFSANASNIDPHILLNASGAPLNPPFSLSFPPFFFTSPATTNQIELNCLAIQTLLPFKHTTNVPSSSSLNRILYLAP